MERLLQPFAEQLMAGNQKQAWETILQLSLDGRTRLEIYGFLTEAMRYVGDMWENNRISVADEHIATGVCEFVLTQYSYYNSFYQDAILGMPRVLMFCPEGEEHDLSLKMLSGLFREAHWNVLNLGSNLPLKFALAKADQWKPEAVAISATLVFHLPQLKNYIRTLESLPHHPKVIVGGRLISRYDISGYGSKRTVFLQDLNQLEEWLSHYSQNKDSFPQVT